MNVVLNTRFTLNETRRKFAGVDAIAELKIEDLIKDTLPPETPSFVQRVVGTRKSKNAITASIEVFDGVCETLEVYSHNGLWRFRWLELSQTFYWDGSRWKRDALVQAELNLPEPILEEPNAVTPNMFEVPL